MSEFVYCEAELLFQASGSMKLLRIWMERITKHTVLSWNAHLQEELGTLKIIVMGTKKNLNNIHSFYQPSAALQSFYEKMQELLNKIDTKEISMIRSICISIQNQIDYIVNDLEKKRKILYEA